MICLTNRNKTTKSKSICVFFALTSICLKNIWQVWGIPIKEVAIEGMNCNKRLYFSRNREKNCLVLCKKDFLPLFYIVLKSTISVLKVLGLQHSQKALQLTFLPFLFPVRFLIFICASQRCFWLWSIWVWVFWRHR